MTPITPPSPPWTLESTSDDQATADSPSWKATFDAMGSPCEILMEEVDRTQANRLAETAWQEAKRVEEHYSRYRPDNILHQVNHSNGHWVEMGSELQQLLQFADQVYEMSDGLFDVTSGVLRKVWKFNQGSTIPTQRQIAKILPLIGWEKVTMEGGRVKLPKGMEIDLGGIAKEYAVDLTLIKLKQLAYEMTSSTPPLLVNFGGDLACCQGMDGKGNRKPKSWSVGIERYDALGSVTPLTICLSSGGLATSGDTRRYLIHKGERYSHILNPKTGWPVVNAPHSVTIAANSCLEAGMLATLASLQGETCEAALKELEVDYWIQQ